jgi:hypothetical protein
VSEGSVDVPFPPPDEKEEGNFYPASIFLMRKDVTPA